MRLHCTLFWRYVLCDSFVCSFYALAFRHWWNLAPQNFLFQNLLCFCMRYSSLLPSRRHFLWRVHMQWSVHNVSNSLVSKCSSAANTLSQVRTFTFSKEDRKITWVAAIQQDIWLPMKNLQICFALFCQGGPSSDPTHNNRFTWWSCMEHKGKCHFEAVF